MVINYDEQMRKRLCKLLSENYGLSVDVFGPDKVMPANDLPAVLAEMLSGNVDDMDNFRKFLEEEHGIQIHQKYWDVVSILLGISNLNFESQKDFEDHIMSMLDENSTTDSNLQ